MSKTLKVLILKGLPASGKTTWAKEFVTLNPGWKRINKDLLREMLDSGVWSGKNEKFILRVRDMLILEILDQGFNIIVDDTNLHPKHLQQIKSIVPVGVEVEEKLFEVPLMECIHRDAARPNPVGRRRIFEMWQQFLKPPLKDPNPDQSPAIIVDLDGTLANHSDRSPYDYTKVKQDDCYLDVAHLVNFFSTNYTIIAVSGRPDNARKDTEEWLHEHLIMFDHLFMRKADDNRPDDVVKDEIYERTIKTAYDVQYVLDDRDRVVWMWRQKGLRVLQVAYGPF